MNLRSGLGVRCLTWLVVAVLVGCGGGGGGGGGDSGGGTPPPVATAPSITSQPADASAASGASASFSVQASGSGPLAYAWQRDGQAIAGATSSTYSLPSVGAGDNGATFSVLISNSAGSVTSRSAVLNVSGAVVLAPTISAQPADISVTSGASALFSVQASGSGLLAYAWQRDGQAIPGATSSSYSIPAVSAGESGARFSVLISNAAGNVLSRTATLTVPPTPGVNFLAGGLGGPGYTDGTGAAARLGAVGWSAISVDAAGNTYMADRDNNTIRKVTPTGVVTTIAGQPGLGAYVDGSANVARFNAPQSLAVGPSGDIFVHDKNNHCIRRIDTNGVVSTLAGASNPALFEDADGTGAAAFFSGVKAMTVDQSNNVLITSIQDTVRKITPAGVVTTLAGSVTGYQDGPGAQAKFGSMISIATDSRGDILVVDIGNRLIRKVTPTGTVSTFIGMKDDPRTVDGVGTQARVVAYGSISRNGNGDVMLQELSETNESVLRKISLDGTITTVRRLNLYPEYILQIAYTDSGDVIANTQAQSRLFRIKSDGRIEDIAGTTNKTGYQEGIGATARFRSPAGVAVDSKGVAYVADFGNNNIWKIAADGAVTAFAGSTSQTWGHVDGIGAAAQFGYLGQLAVDSKDNLVAIDARGFLRKITPSAAVVTIADFGGEDINAMAVDVDDSILVCTLNGGIWRVFQDSTKVMLWPKPNTCYGIVVLPSLGTFVTGFVYDQTNTSVALGYFKLNADGSRTLIAGGSIAGHQDGQGGAAGFGDVARNLVRDELNNVYFVEVSEAVLRKITPDGTVSTVFGVPGKRQVVMGSPGGLSAPSAVAYVPGSAGKRLVVTDQYENGVLNVNLP